MKIVTLKTFALGLAFVAASASQSLAGCHIERFRFFFGSDTSTTGNVTSGSTCTIEPGAGRGSGIESVSISQPPQHGSASASGSSVYPKITYRPSAGYKGPDEFTFAITGGGKRLQGTSNVHVTMDVK